MNRDPFAPVLVAAWLAASSLALWGLQQAPPAQIEVPVTAPVEGEP